MQLKVRTCMTAYSLLCLVQPTEGFHSFGPGSFRGSHAFARNVRSGASSVKMLDASIIEPVLAVSLLVASARKLPRRGRVLERVFSGEYGLRGRHGTLLRALGERETSSGNRGSEMV